MKNYVNVRASEYAALKNVASKANGLFDKLEMGFVKDSPLDQLKQAVKTLADARGSSSEAGLYPSRFCAPSACIDK